MMLIRVLENLIEVPASKMLIRLLTPLLFIRGITVKNNLYSKAGVER